MPKRGGWPKGFKLKDQNTWNKLSDERRAYIDRHKVAEYYRYAAPNSQREREKFDLMTQMEDYAKNRILDKYKADNPNFNGNTLINYKRKKGTAPPIRRRYRRVPINNNNANNNNNNANANANNNQPPPLVPSLRHSNQNTQSTQPPPQDNSAAFQEYDNHLASLNAYNDDNSFLDEILDSPRGSGKPKKKKILSTKQKLALAYGRAVRRAKLNK